MNVGICMYKLYKFWFELKDIFMILVCKISVLIILFKWFISIYIDE